MERVTDTESPGLRGIFFFSLSRPLFRSLLLVPHAREILCFFLHTQTQNSRRRRRGRGRQEEEEEEEEEAAADESTM
jgi:hypothetical protein